MINNKKNKVPVVSSIRKIWKQGDLKIISIPKSSPLQIGDYVLVLKLDENLLALPEGTHNYIKVHLNQQLK